MEWPRLRLKDGNLVPMLGLRIGSKSDLNAPPDPELIKALKTALSKGFIHLEIGDMDGTECEVGIAIKDSGIRRDKLFITTQISTGWDDVPATLQKSLERLQLEYVDLYLLRHPDGPMAEFDIGRAWKGLEAVKAAGLTRSIGVSGISRHLLRDLLCDCTEPPVMNHLWICPSGSYIDLQWMRKKGMEISCSHPSLSLRSWVTDIFGTHPLAQVHSSIAARHGTNPSAVLLSWVIAQNLVPIVTILSGPDTVDEYLPAIALRLTAEEQEEIMQVGYHRMLLTKEYPRLDAGS